jgi:hypothetical protein
VFFIASLLSVLLILREFASFGSIASLILLSHEFPLRILDFIYGDDFKYKWQKEARKVFGIKF